MAQTTGTFDSYDIRGAREDLSNVIYNISPHEHPFMSSVDKIKVKATKHEWQTDALAAAVTTNAFIEGDEFTYADPSATVRVGNFCQIMRKEVQVSGTVEAVDKAGRDKEMALQLSKRMKELKNDAETTYLFNQASVAGTSTVARKLGGLPSWLTSNDSRIGTEGGYSSGTGLTVAATDGTARTFTETLLKDVLQLMVRNGAKPKMLLVGPFNKRTFSGFTGISDIRTNYSGDKMKQASVLAGADIYLSDFGELAVTWDLFTQERNAFLIDPEYAAIGTLRPLKMEDAAKTSDAEKKVLLMETTLVVRNQAAHGIVADLTTA